MDNKMLAGCATTSRHGLIEFPCMACRALSWADSYSIAAAAVAEISQLTDCRLSWHILIVFSSRNKIYLFCLSPKSSIQMEVYSQLHNSIQKQ